MLSSEKSEKGREEAMNGSSIKKMKELGEKLQGSVQGLLSGRQGDHVQRGVRRPVRHSGALEKETGIVLADSPTVNVGYEAVEQLPRRNMRDRCCLWIRPKEREALREFIGGTSYTFILEAGWLNDRAYL